MIEVGEYVRTRKGIIGKLRGSYLHGINIEYPQPQEWIIDRFNNRKNYYVITECDVDFDDIVKHSKNIIDLIEVGDYVNGLYVHMITEFGLKIYSNGDIEDILKEDEVKSIVTKEQFANIEYKLNT